MDLQVLRVAAARRGGAAGIDGLGGPDVASCRADRTAASNSRILKTGGGLDPAGLARRIRHAADLLGLAPGQPPRLQMRRGRPAVARPTAKR